MTAVVLGFFAFNIVCVHHLLTVKAPQSPFEHMVKKWFKIILRSLIFKRLLKKLILLFKTEFANVGTTVYPLQQKNAMQNNLKKLQQEMAVLEAVLKQHGSQDCAFLPIHRELPRSSNEGTLKMEQMRQERGK